MSSLEYYLVPPAAASIAVIPVFYGFMAKSSLQLGGSLPKAAVKTALKEGCKASPIFGGIIGIQLIAQNILEKKFLGPSPSFSSLIGCSMAAGIVSTPALAVFNGQTMGKQFSNPLEHFL